VDAQRLEATTMGERVLRGSRLGTTSYEVDRNTDLAPRQDVTFDCPHGHTFTVPMSADAELPGTWECRVCGIPGIRRDGSGEPAKKVKHARTHWDMLLERRSIPELEAILAERLELLREHGRRKTA